MTVRTTVDRGRQVRLQLLSAAGELIAERGWTAVSTRILAERANVAPGLVHYHFSSLQALLRSAALGLISNLLSAPNRASRTPKPSTPGVDMLLGSFDAYTSSDPTSLLLAEAYLAATRDETLRVELVALLEEFCQQLARWLGEHGADTPYATASVVAAIIDGVMLHRSLDPELTSSVIAPIVRRLVSHPIRPGENARRREVPNKSSD